MPSTVPLPLAIVMTSFSPGGTERQMIELVRRLDRSRWTVYVACFHTQGVWFDRVAEAARAVVEFPMTSFRRPCFLRQLGAFAAWCRRMRFAVVHTVDMQANMFGLPGAALAGVPVRVANRRDVNPGRRATELVWQRAAYVWAHVIVANCGAAAARLRKERVPARRIQVIPNGLEIDAYPPRTYASRPRRVVTVGDLRSEKGHATLIAAAADVLREFPDAQFEIVGAGPELARLQSLTRSHGVSHAVFFAGHREDVAARLAAADAFALPSRSEAMPNALLEAMGAGLPIVASHVGGVPELIEHERSGLLVPHDDARALSSSIRRLLGDPELGRRLGRAARQAVERRFSFDRMVRAFDAVYANELARRRVPHMQAAEGAA